jgi:hypothetical protein
VAASEVICLCVVLAGLACSLAAHRIILKKGK